MVHGLPVEWRRSSAFLVTQGRMWSGIGLFRAFFHAGLRRVTHPGDAHLGWDAGLLAFSHGPRLRDARGPVVEYWASHETFVLLVARGAWRPDRPGTVWGQPRGHRALEPAIRPCDHLALVSQGRGAALPRPHQVLRS